MTPSGYAAKPFKDMTTGIRGLPSPGFVQPGIGCIFLRRLSPTATPRDQRQSGRRQREHGRQRRGSAEPRQPQVGAEVRTTVTGSWRVVAPPRLTSSDSGRADSLSDSSSGVVASKGDPIGCPKRVASQATEACGA